MQRFLSAALVLALPLLTTSSLRAVAPQGSRTLMRDAFCLLNFEPKTLGRRDDRIVVNGQRGESSIASLHNGASVVPVGVAGAGAYFDGDKSFLAVYGLRESEKPLSEFSIAMWVKSQTGGSSRFLFDWRAPKGGSPSMIRLFAYDDGVRFGAAGVEVESLLKIHDNQWRHLAATWKGNVRRLYLNGQLIAEKTGDFTALTPAQMKDSRPRVGAQSTGSRGPRPKQEPRTFHGVIDEVYLARQAIQPADVQALFERGRARRPLTAR